MLFAVVSSVVLALSPVVAEQQSIIQTDQSITDALQRLNAELDAESSSALRANQEVWEKRTQSLEARASQIFQEEEDPERELEKFKLSWRKQRLSFLTELKSVPATDVRGVWTDGVTDILLDYRGETRAKIATSSDSEEGKSLFCVVEGTVQRTPNGLTITSDKSGGGVLLLSQKGITLSIEPDSQATKNMALHCQAGGVLSGSYFRIDGGEVILPWLL